MKKTIIYTFVPLLFFFICSCSQQQYHEQLVPENQTEDQIPLEERIPIAEGDLIVSGMSLDEINNIFGMPACSLQYESIEGYEYDVSVYYKDYKVVRWTFNHPDYQNEKDPSKVKKLPLLNEHLKIGMSFDEVNKLIGRPIAESFDEKMILCCDYSIRVFFVNGKVLKYLDRRTLDKDQRKQTEETKKTLSNMKKPVSLGKLKYKMLLVPEGSEEIQDNLEKNGFVDMAEIDGTALANALSFEAMTYDGGSQDSGMWLITFQLDSVEGPKVNKFLRGNPGKLCFIICEGMIIVKFMSLGGNWDRYDLLVDANAFQHILKKKQSSSDNAIDDNK